MNPNPDSMPIIKQILLNHLLINHRLLGRISPNLLLNHLLINHILLRHILLNHILLNHLLINHILLSHMLLNHQLINRILLSHRLIDHLSISHLLINDLLTTRARSSTRAITLHRRRAKSSRGTSSSGSKTVPPSISPVDNEAVNTIFFPNEKKQNPSESLNQMQNKQRNPTSQHEQSSKQIVPKKISYPTLL